MAGAQQTGAGISRTVPVAQGGTTGDPGQLGTDQRRAELPEEHGRDSDLDGQISTSELSAETPEQDGERQGIRADPFVPDESVDIWPRALRYP